MAKLIKSEFKAWIDKMPPGPAKLIAIGQIEVPTGGYSATLTKAVPQGVNPKILLLNASVHAPTGNVIQVISRIDVRFEESPPAVNYTQVTVQLDADSVTVEVTETH